MASRIEFDRHAERLERLLAARDWAAIAACDRKIAACLSSVHPATDWAEAERAALRRLRRIHAQVREQCRQELARLGEQLTHMRTNKDGWIAYGLSDEFEAQT